MSLPEKSSTGSENSHKGVIRVKFIQIFAGDIDSVQQEANQWVYNNKVDVVDYRHQYSSPDFHVITVVYNASAPVPVKTEEVKEENQKSEAEPEPVVPVEDDLPF
jgi:hypothetical protein